MTDAIIVTPRRRRDRSTAKAIQGVLNHPDMVRKACDAFLNTLFSQVILKSNEVPKELLEGMTRR